MMTLSNGPKILIVSNLITIAVTATAVLIGLHLNHQQQDHTTASSSMMLDHKGLQQEHGERFLQNNNDCCDCTTGLPFAPTSAPTRPPTPTFCFPNHATVQLINGETASLDSIPIGTKVHVGNNRFEPIYSYGHHDVHSVSHDYIQFTTNDNHDNDNNNNNNINYKKKNNKNKLIMSPRHLVWTCNHGNYIPAEDVKLGDELLVHQYNDNDNNNNNNLNGHEHCQVVSDIQTQLSHRGLLAPFTPSGTLMVNGIKVSSFIAMKHFHAPQYAHSMAHAFEFPHRIVCHYLGNTCPNEQYTSDGISTWVAQPLIYAEWLVSKMHKYQQQQHEDNENQKGGRGEDGPQRFLVSILYAIVVTVFVFFTIVENLCFTGCLSTSTQDSNVMMMMMSTNTTISQLLFMLFMIGGALHYYRNYHGFTINQKMKQI